MSARKDIIAAEFFHRYINLGKDDDALQSIQKNTRKFTKFLEEIPKKRIDYQYAAGKWSIKELLQHIIDAERVFAYRALTFSRFDPAELPGFDENRWAANADTKHRKWSDLKKEFANVRGSTKLLFESFTEKQWLATGTASGHPVNCVALAFICCGHVEHHINIIKEKYL